MEKQDKIKAIQTLIDLHIDRESGYEKVSEEATVEDFDLKIMFQNMATSSRRATVFLNAFLAEFGEGKVKHENSFLSKIHQTWIEVKKAISLKDRKALLASCEFGENVIIGAYETILDDEQLVDVEMRMLLNSQLGEIRKSLQVIQQSLKLEEVEE